MPDPSNYDDEEEFVDDCIEERQSERDEDPARSEAACRNMWEDSRSEGGDVSGEGRQTSMGAGRAFSAIVNEPWAMTEQYLATMVHIAAERLQTDVEIAAEFDVPEDGPEPKSLAAETGEVLEGSRRVLVRDGIGVIPVVGPIFRRANLITKVSGATSLETLARDFRVAEESPDVRAILLDVDSPGGEANGVAEMSDMIFESETPVRAFVGGSGLSGGFWLASAADEVVASETALLGSIGVRTAVTDTRERDRERGVRRIQFVSSQSPRKAPDPTEEEGQEQIQTVVDQIADVFVEHVARNRGVSRQTVLNDFGRGGVLVGESAVDRGLADRIGTFEDEIERLAGPSPEQQGQVRIGTSEESEMSAESEEQQTEIRVEPPESMTAEEVREHYPEAAEEIAADAREEERGRIQAIEEIEEPGHDELVHRAKFEEPTSADAVSRQILERRKQQREDRLNARAADEEDLEAPDARAGAAEADEEEDVRSVLAAARKAGVVR